MLTLNFLTEQLGVKAELRNPDEFYHKMHSAKMIDGTHTVTLKTNQEKGRRMQEDRNIALVNLKRQMEAKKAEKLKKNLHLIDFPKANQKISFVSSYDQIKQTTMIERDQDVENAKMTGI